MLLCADLHLTDNPLEEYRWRVFKFLLERHEQFGPCDIFILGDLCDRKDRHSAELVNRLVSELTSLRDAMRIADALAEIHIIMGNHDAPLKGAPFWSFFEHIEGIHFYTEPAVLGEVLLLPFTPNPAEAWADIDFDEYRCFMLHQPLEGARGANGRALAKGSPMPAFPKGAKIYAGDIHGPQKVGRVEYVGSPHPVAFDENHLFRFLHLDENYRAETITLLPMRRHLIDLQGDEVPKLPTRGDQVKLRVHMPLAKIGRWPAKKAEIEAWAEAQGVLLVSLEPVVEAGEAPEEATPGLAMGEAPDEVLSAFAAQDGIKGRTLKAGRRLLAASIEKGT